MCGIVKFSFFARESVYNAISNRDVETICFMKSFFVASTRKYMILNREICHFVTSVMISTQINECWCRGILCTMPNSIAKSTNVFNSWYGIFLLSYMGDSSCSASALSFGFVSYPFLSGYTFGLLWGWVNGCLMSWRVHGWVILQTKYRHSSLRSQI